MHDGRSPRGLRTTITCVKCQRSVKSRANKDWQSSDSRKAAISAWNLLMHGLKVAS